MKELTRRQKKYKSMLAELVATNEKARKVSERYNLRRFLLQSEYPGIVKLASKETMIEFLRDAEFIDRQVRKATEGFDQAKKFELAKEKMSELEYLV